MRIDPPTYPSHEPNFYRKPPLGVVCADCLTGTLFWTLRDPPWVGWKCHWCHPPDVPDHKIMLILTT
jgi:hypothetical protein